MKDTGFLKQDAADDFERIDKRQQKAWLSIFSICDNSLDKGYEAMTLLLRNAKKRSDGWKVNAKCLAGTFARTSS